ncbi:unnamed protein product [Durusdinium trenchii]|uniref:Uncharacterized protein n=2 Tax=Durusdinium trenchii TaxID=1381693 RepID=A0ABP0K7V0_9DINO
MDQVPPLSPVDWPDERGPSLSALSARSSTERGLTTGSRHGTPRDHERRGLEELRERRAGASPRKVPEDVPSLRLGLLSPRSSSSDVTSRSELFEPQISSGEKSREIQDLCREMEAMRHVIQQDLAQMRKTWTDLQVSAASAGPKPLETQEIHWFLPEVSQVHEVPPVEALGAIWHLQMEEEPSESGAWCFSLRSPSGSSSGCAWRINLSVQLAGSDPPLVLGELSGARLEEGPPSLHLQCARQRPLLCKASVQLRGTRRQQILCQVSASEKEKRPGGVFVEKQRCGT